MVPFLSPNPLVINPYTKIYQAKRMAHHFLANPWLVAVVGLRYLALYVTGRSLTLLWTIANGLILARRSIDVLYPRTPELNFYTPTESLPLLMYQEVEKSNAQKMDKDLALHLWAAEDYNDGVTGIGGAVFVLQTAATHRVAIRTVRTASSIQSTLQEVEKNHGPIDILYIHGHGNPHVIQLSTPPFWKLLLATKTGNRKWISDYFCQGSTPLPFAGKTIALLSCSTGKIPEEGGLPIAGEIAARLQKVVWAPTQDVGAIGLLQYSSSLEQKPLFAWYQQGVDVMACFGPEGKKTPFEMSSQSESLQKGLQELSVRLAPLVTGNGQRCRNIWHGYLWQLQEALPEILKGSITFPLGFERPKNPQ